MHEIFYACDYNTFVNPFMIKTEEPAFTIKVLHSNSLMVFKLVPEIHSMPY